MPHIPILFFTEESSNTYKLNVFLESFHFDIKHFLLIYTHILCCAVRHKHIAKQCIKIKLDYYLNINYDSYDFLFL